MRINGGLYLIIDPRVGFKKISFQLEEALKGGVDIVQIRNVWADNDSWESKEELIQYICKLTHSYGKPILIHQDWTWLTRTSELDGVHFDCPPEDWTKIQDKIKRPFLKGITCTNTLSDIYWAIGQSFDYLSFCTLYPSPSADYSELVDPQIIYFVQEITSIPVFATGTIDVDTISTIMKLRVNGVAVLSPIMNAENPRIIANRLKMAIKEKQPLYRWLDH